MNLSIILAASVILWAVIIAAWQTVWGEIGVYAVFAAWVGWGMVRCRW